MNRPNLLFITCHDLGRHLGCYGIPTVHSPQIDALAAEGVRFSESFCVAPQCSPSRATMFTGQYPHTNGVMGLTHGDFAWSLNPDSRHLASLLLEAGWHTGLAGGQHETHEPASIGFKQICGDGGFKPCGEVVEQCREFLREACGRDQPFYLQVGFFEPHRPFDFGAVKPDRSQGVTLMPYLVEDSGAEAECAALQGAIRKVDEAIGLILKTLDELDLTENTLLVFTTDHGLPFPRAKCSVYDPGLQTCLILRWPSARWPAAQTTVPAIVSNLDYMPTLLDVIGLPIPDNIQGKSFAALLRGQTYRPREEIFAEMTYHDYYDPRRCIRTPTHKLIVNFSNARAFMDPSQEWYHSSRPVHPADPVNSFHPPVEFYDLKADPGETINLADSPVHAALRERLLDKLLHWMRETADPLLFGVPISPMHRAALTALGTEIQR